MTETKSATADNAELAADRILGKLDERIAAGVDKALDGALEKREPKLVASIAASVAKVFAEAKGPGSPASKRDEGDEVDEGAPRRRRFTIPGLAVDSNEVKDYHLGKAILGLLSGDPERYCPHEWEMSKAASEDEGEQFHNPPPFVMRQQLGMRRKNMASQPDSQLGIIVPSQVLSAKIIPLLESAMIASKVGAQRLDGLFGSPCHVPKETDDVDAFWVNHDTTDDPTAVTKSNMKMGQIAFTPKTLASRVELSNRLINLSTPAAEQIVNRRIGRKMGIKWDKAVFNGSGGSGEPVGLLSRGIQTETIGDLTASGAYDKLIDMQTKVYAADVLSTQWFWAFHPNNLGKMRKMKDPTDASQPKERRVLGDGPMERILGAPYFISSHLPTDQVLFGAGDYILLGQWGGMFLSIDSQAVNGKFTTTILAGMEVDTNLAQDFAFCSGSVS